jgi:hypothetical protein
LRRHRSPHRGAQPTEPAPWTIDAGTDREAGGLSSWRTWPKVNNRTNVPSVEGALTWPNNRPFRRGAEQPCPRSSPRRIHPANQRQHLRRGVRPALGHDLNMLAEQRGLAATGGQWCTRAQPEC